MKTLLTKGFGLLILANLAALSTWTPAFAEPWEFLARVPGARYTYDLTTTPRSVYMVLGDSLENTMGLYRYDRLAPGVEMEFVGKPGEPLYGVYVGGENDEHIWLGSDGTSDDPDYLWYSSDGGETWVVKGSAWYGKYFGLTGSRDGSHVYAAPDVILCFQSSSDYGETWTWWGSCSSQQLYGARGMEVDFFNPNRAYACIVDWFIWSTAFGETTNGGQDWEGEYLGGSMPAYGAVYPSPYREGDFGLADDSGYIYTRIDGAWSHLPYVGLSPTYGIAQPVWDGGSWWIAGVRRDTIRVKRNSGGAWAAWEEGLPRVVLPESEHHRARLWACPINGDVFLLLPNGGLWLYQGPTTSAPEVSLVVGPWGQVYPNPSHGQVTLTVGSLPRASYRLVVFDVLGRKVRILHEGTLEGSSTWTWNGRDASGRGLPSGVYLLQLTDLTGRSSLSKKVLLLE
jgi:hypothetical protein